MIKKYADLLINYCLQLKKGEKLMIESSPLAEDLVREVYTAALLAGANPEVSISVNGLDYLFYKNAGNDQLKYVSPLNKTVMQSYDALLKIKAPYNLNSLAGISAEKKKIVNESNLEISKIFSRRSSSGELKWTICQYPTDSLAQNAGMSLGEYYDFVYDACYLKYENPVEKWKEVHDFQQQIVDILDSKSKIRYKSKDVDLEFRTDGRKWINSDGRRNMPSGEVFTSPVENSMKGRVRFSYPGFYLGEKITGIELVFDNGKVEKASAEEGNDLLMRLLEIKGADYVGEAAIGTNERIKKFTGNILFDEKIGGTVHIALGNSYPEAGGKNVSSVHWDLIADMKNDGEIYADDELIYRNGKFIFCNARDQGR